jgi:hypothetical protein
MQQRPYLTLLSPPALSLRLGPALTPPSPPGRRVGEATPAAALASISDDTVLLDVLALDALGPGALPQLRALVRPWTESLLAPRLATACAWAVSDAVALPRRTAVIVALCQVWVRHAPLRPGAAEPSAPSPAPAPALLSGSPCGSSARVPSSPASTPSTAALVSSPIPWSPAAAVAPSAVPGLAAAVAALVDITADVGSGPSTGRPHALVREALLAFVDAFAVDTQPVRRTAARVVPAPAFLTGTRALAPGPGSAPLDRRGDGARGLPVARLDRPWSVLFGGLSGASGRPGRGVLGVLADPRRGTHRGATCPQSTTYTAGGDPTDLATCTLTMCIACILGRATDAIVCSRTGTVNVSWRRSTVFGTFAGPCLRLGVLPSHAARCNLTAVPDGPSGVGDRWGCMRKRVCSVQAAQAPPTRQHHGTLSIWRWNWPYSCPCTTRCDAALLPALGSALVPDTVREHQARASRQLRARIAAAAYHQSGVPDWGRLLTAGLGHGRHGTLLLDDTTPQGHPPAPSAILSAWSTWLHTMDALHALDDLLAVRWPPWSMCFRMR